MVAYVAMRYGVSPMVASDVTLSARNRITNVILRHLSLGLNPGFAGKAGGLGRACFAPRVAVHVTQGTACGLAAGHARHARCVGRATHDVANRSERSLYAYWNAMRTKRLPDDAGAKRGAIHA